jgi:mercuric ion binding protein
MRNSILAVFFTLFSLSVSAQEGKKNQKAVIQTVLNCNHCKVCETCGKNFQENILKIKGVKMYELDEEKMTLTVYYNAQKTDLGTIKTAISKMGYDADDIKADAVAYAQLDRCCKKE